MNQTVQDTTPTSGVYQPQPSQPEQVQEPIAQTPAEETTSEGETATQTLPELPQAPPPKKLIVIPILLVLVVGLGLLGYFLFLRPSYQESITETGRIVLTPSPAIPKAEPAQAPGVSHYVGSQSITIRDVADTNFSATAYRSVIPGHVFWAVYTNLPDPEEGKFYQMWLMHDESNFFPAGRLFKDASGRYTTVFGFEFNSSAQFFRTVDEFPNIVVVALETVDDTSMETRILEGTFTR